MCNGCGHKVLETVSTVGRGAIGVTKSAIGIGLADERTIQQRLDICRHCPHALKNPSPMFAKFLGLTNKSKCSVCECFIFHKSRLNKESCPMDKWPVFLTN